MKCPYCQADDQTKVVDSRSSGDGVRRRRECEMCRKRFTTYEYIERVSIAVVKRDRRREEFNKQKLLKGIDIACTKRPVSFEDKEKLAQNVLKKVETLGKSEIESRDIGEMVMDELYKLDQIAFVRFASVYRKFESLGDFVEQVSTLREE